MANNPQMYKPRNGEAGMPEFTRSGRFYCVNNNWFFKTREGLNYGPYSSKTECRYAYDEFIDVVSASNELGGIPVDFDDTSTSWTVPKINFN